MKPFTEFLEEFEHTNQPIDERMFNGGQINPENHSKTKPVFAKAVNEDGGAIGGMTAPSIPHGPDGAPGPILGPGSDCVMPTVINGNAPAHCLHPPYHHAPPRPAPFRRYLHLVAPIGRVIVINKKKKKSKKSKRRQPKNPYK